MNAAMVAIERNKRMLMQKGITFNRDARSFARYIIWKNCRCCFIGAFDWHLLWMDEGAVIMAQRYGGEYSPNTPPHSKLDQTQHSKNDGPKRPQKEGKRRRKMVAKATGRSNALFIPSFIMPWRALGDGAVDLILALCAAFLFGLSAWLLKQGMRAEVEFRSD